MKSFFIEKHIQIYFTVSFQYFKIFDTYSCFKFSFKLKIDQKMQNFKNLEDVLKTWKNF